MRLAFDHVHLRSSDPEATAAWYERVLGAEVIRGEAGGRPRLDLRLGGLTLFIGPVSPDGPTGEAPRAPYRGLEHLGFAVDDVAQALAAARAHGAEVALEVTEARPGVHIAFLRGPEGVSIELLQRSPA